MSTIFGGHIEKKTSNQRTNARARTRTSCVQIRCHRLAFRNVGSRLNYTHGFFDTSKNGNFIDEKNFGQFFWKKKLSKFFDRPKNFHFSLYQKNEKKPWA